MISLELPYPPSVNSLYKNRRGGGKRLSERHSVYRDKVWAICRQQKVLKLHGNLECTLFLFPPDKRKRDVDNVLKALLDSLEHAGAFHDDNQIRKLTLERELPEPPGRVLVWLKREE